MKKIFVSIMFLLAFSISANAQVKKISNEELAKKDAVTLTQFLGLNDTQNADFFRLFVMKYEVFNNPDASKERKEETKNIMRAKIEASLDAKQFEKLLVNKDLFNSLIGYGSTASSIKK